MFQPPQHVRACAHTNTYSGQILLSACSTNLSNRTKANHSKGIHMMCEAACCLLVWEKRLHWIVELLWNAFLCYLVVGTAKSQMCYVVRGCVHWPGRADTFWGEYLNVRVWNQPGINTCEAEWLRKTSGNSGYGGTSLRYAPLARKEEKAILEAEFIMGLTFYMLFSVCNHWNCFCLDKGDFSKMQ